MRKHSTGAIAASVNVVPVQSEPEVPISAPSAIPWQAARYPELRYMGSKKRLLPWIHQVLDNLDFDTGLDPFTGSGCVAYLIKAMGRRVVAADFLNFSSIIARATVQNNKQQLDDKAIEALIVKRSNPNNFVERTFAGVFFTVEDLRFLDRISANIRQLENPYHQALAFSAVFRSCLKRQPRGVFTVSGNLSRYDDGRRDLKLSLEEHFLEQVQVFNASVFDNGRRNRALCADIFGLPRQRVDLVYLDPPYVPRADDNCYVKRYHLLEGLSCYWRGLPVDTSTRVKRIAKRYTPFSYRRTAVGAFDRMFARFAKSIIVLSYSSNGYPDLVQIEALLRKYKRTIRIFEKPHRYPFRDPQRCRASDGKRIPDCRVLMRAIFGASTTCLS
jgi:DNA adenine methylase/adenine-specific DNA-methyltransferase